MKTKIYKETFSLFDNEYKDILTLDNTIRVLSLFSGCGGMDIGFEGDFICLGKSINDKLYNNWIEEKNGIWVRVKKTGFETVFANDIKPEAKAAWTSFFCNRYDNANERYHVASIVDLVKRAKNGEKIFPSKIDIVTGGFPCQDFSIAGKRKGFCSEKSHNGEKMKIDEPSIESRGQLYMWMRDVIILTKPRLFIAENVKGLTNLKDVKKIIERDFASACDGGYLVVPARVLNAADYGVPQSRERVIFYGFRKNALTKEAIKKLQLEQIPEKYDPYPLKTHNYNFHDLKLKDFVNCQDILGDLAEPDNTTDISQIKYSKAKYMGNHCQGQVEIKLDSVAPTIRSEHHGNIEFRRLSIEHGGTHLEEIKNGLQERRLTIRECARIQTFPDDYQFILPQINDLVSVNASNAYKLIGNAVPCVLAYNIAMRIKENWNLYFKGNMQIS